MFSSEPFFAMKTLSPTLHGPALGAAAMISFSAGAFVPQAGAQEIVPAPPPEGSTVIVLPPGAAPPVQVQEAPVPPPEPKKRGFFSRLFGGDKEDRPDEPDNDDDGDTNRMRQAPKAELVIEGAPPPGTTVAPVPPQQQIPGQPAMKTEIRKEPARKSSGSSRRSSTIVETAPPTPAPKVEMDLPPPDSTATVESTRTLKRTEVKPAAAPVVRTLPERTAVTESTTQIQKPPTIRELPARNATTSSVAATATLPSDQALIEQARAKTEMKKALEASKPEVEITQERTSVQPAPTVQTQTTRVESTAPASDTSVMEQQRLLAETKEELARLKGEVATVKQELQTTRSTSSSGVDVSKVTIASPNEAAPITPSEPADAAATPPARAGSVAGSEAPTDRTMVKPSEPPGGLAPAASSTDNVTLGTSAAKESGKPASATAANGDGDDSSSNVPVGTKTDSPNFVRSPFPPHNKLDITGMKPGALAKDPTNGKVFRVP